MLRRYSVLLLFVLTMPLAIMAQGSAVTSDNALEVQSLLLANGAKPDDNISGIDNRRFQIVDNLADLQLLWAEHFALHAGYPPLPDIDFARQRLVAAFAGKSFPGQSIEITAAYEYDEFIDVVIVETMREGCAMNDRNIQPHAFAIIPASTKPVYFTHIISSAGREKESC